MTNKQIAGGIAAAVSGAIVFGWAWSTLRLDNEIKWLRQNKTYVCSQLLNKDLVLRGYQRNTHKATYDDNKTNGINQAFLGTVMTTLAVERQTVNNMQLHYGCQIPAYQSHAE